MTSTRAPLRMNAFISLPSDGVDDAVGPNVDLRRLERNRALDVGGRPAFHAIQATSRQESLFACMFHTQVPDLRWLFAAEAARSGQKKRPRFLAASSSIKHSADSVSRRHTHTDAKTLARVVVQARDIDLTAVAVLD